MKVSFFSGITLYEDDGPKETMTNPCSFERSDENYPARAFDVVVSAAVPVAAFATASINLILAGVRGDNDGETANYWALVLGALLLALALSAVMKKSGYSLILQRFADPYRPADARACDVFSRKGNVGGAPGMPSGHAAVATTFAILVFIWPAGRALTKTASDSVSAFAATSIILVGLLIIVLTAIARIRKKCHTVAQVVAGCALGTAVSVPTAALAASCCRPAATAAT